MARKDSAPPCINHRIAAAGLSSVCLLGAEPRQSCGLGIQGLVPGARLSGIPGQGLEL